MAIYAWGAAWPKPSYMTMDLNLNELRQVAEFSRVIHRQANGGERWEVSLTWDGMSSTERHRLVGVFRRMNQRLTAHHYRIPLWMELNEGDFGGTPLVNEAGGKSAGATNIDFDGASINVTDWAEEGDYFKFANHEALYQFIFGNSSDGTGNVASAAFSPPLRVDVPDDTAVTIHKNRAGNETTVLDVVCEMAEIPPIDARDVLASGEAYSRGVTISLLESLDPS